eukprot:CAMPEP_0113937692 /NCGR_PEP_ID=MMETSP1339-20121228/4254_1 /TAXON_ID=94617 /ORGANISM="Fibrocapsa japonica" /LENGTH=530 /DNA_ID=CAMNT_0000940555 /DNA_START=55 /DNA_END=1647 /DNA_ORIENTATION=+ /assembly_acc=CAM_ASM_000762
MKSLSDISSPEAILDLVADYLSTKGFSETEKTLREEARRNNALFRTESSSSNNQRSGSRLEDLLEKSYVTEALSGSSTSNRKRARRTHLDAILLPEGGKDKDAEGAVGSSSGRGAQQEEKKLSMATKIAGYDPCKGDPHGAACMPIYQTSTFAQPSATSFGEYDYTRSGNPTRKAFEEQIAQLENGCRAFAFTSGMAALSAITRLAQAGDEIILSDDSYGGTYRLLAKVAARNNIRIRYLDMSGHQGPANLQAAISESTKLVMLESPTNPMQRIIGISDIARVAHTKGALVSVDNTMLSPILQNPLDLGADICMHSATKFICGHSDTMSGVVVVKDPALAEQVYFFQNAEGTGLSPFDSWLLLRGVKTMQLRVMAQQANCERVARFLQNHPAITTVNYAGLEDFPGHDLHRSQARGAGSVLSFRTGSLAFSQHIVSTTKLFKITVSFGSVNSLISLPGAMSHASIPAEVRAAREFPEDLVRLSIGIESVDDLIGDLSAAIQSYNTPKSSVDKMDKPKSEGGSSTEDAKSS